MMSRNMVTALRRLPRVVAAALLLGATACDKPQAVGDTSALMVAVTAAEWATIREEVETSLEPRAFTVRNERIFRVTQVDPQGPYWNNARKFQQVVLIGEPGDEWIAEVLNEAGTQPTELPAAVEARNVWARGQQVTALVVPPRASAAAARPLLPGLAQSIRQRHHALIQQRMFASGINEALADSLGRHAGFTIQIPQIYRVERPDPNTLMLVNDQPDPAQLQRVVLVTWRPAGEVAATPEAVLEWRAEAAQRFYQPPQDTQRDRTPPSPEESPDFVQVQGVWGSLPGAWPAGGPFLARSHTCPDGRTFLLDAWVYAPRTGKYEFLVQMNTILDTFACTVQRAS
jgi:hypothetical protein